MPEATVNEDGYAPAGEDDICGTPEPHDWRLVYTESQTTRE